MGTDAADPVSCVISDPHIGGDENGELEFLAGILETTRDGWTKGSRGAPMSQTRLSGCSRGLTARS